MASAARPPAQKMLVWGLPGSWERRSPTLRKKLSCCEKEGARCQSGRELSWRRANDWVEGGEGWAVMGKE